MQWSLCAFDPRLLSSQKNSWGNGNVNSCVEVDKICNFFRLSSWPKTLCVWRIFPGKCSIVLVIGQLKDTFTLMLWLCHHLYNVHTHPRRSERTNRIYEDQVVASHEPAGPERTLQVQKGHCSGGKIIISNNCLRLPIPPPPLCSHPDIDYFWNRFKTAV